MSLSTRQVVACATAVWVTFGSAPALAQSPAFHLVGIAPGTSGSRATGVSADGRVVAGVSSLGMITPGFTWTREGGRNDFGFEPGLPSQTFAEGISGDGTIIVGLSQTRLAGPATAFRYRGPGAFQTLGILPGVYTESRAYGVSGDGAVVVGSSFIGAGPLASQAFRWTESGGMQPLGFTTPNQFHSEALAVSRDGSTIVGFSGDGATDAFVWTQPTGMRALPSIPGKQNAYARGVNFDGSIIVGQSANSIATMWRDGVRAELGVAPGFFSSNAHAVSDDGSVAVGIVYGFESSAAIWTPGRGMERLPDYLSRLGVVIPAGWNLDVAYGISGDGSTIVGRARSATSTQGFVATIPTPSASALALVAAAAASCRRRRRIAALVAAALAAPALAQTPAFHLVGIAPGTSGERGPTDWFLKGR